MTDVLFDASVVLKWFHEEGEEEVAPARLLLDAHQAGQLTAWILDLTLYELGNVLLRALGWQAAEVAAQLDDVRAICAPLVPGLSALRLAAHLAEKHALTFYDAVYAAAARSHDAALATADKALLASGQGDSPSTIAARLGFSETI